VLITRMRCSCISMQFDGNWMPLEGWSMWLHGIHAWYANLCCVMAVLDQLSWHGSCRPCSMVVVSGCKVFKDLKVLRGP
jgi:hypothetical protein